MSNYPKKKTKQDIFSHILHTLIFEFSFYTLAFKIVTSSHGVQEVNKLVNSSGSWPAQTSCIEGLGDILENLALWNSFMVRIASLRSACHRIIPDPVVILVSLDSWPTSGNQPCHNHSLSIPDSTRNSAKRK